MPDWDSPGDGARKSARDGLPEQSDPPPVIDPALWAEFQAVSDQVHKLANWDAEENGPKPPPVRIMIDLPQELVLLFAWMAQRNRQRQAGKSGPTGLTPETMEALGLQRLARQPVRSYLNWILNEEFHTELHALCGGRHHLLRDKDLKKETEAEATAREAWKKGDLNDDLPF